MPSQKVSFHNSRALKLVGILEKPDDVEGKRPGVIICHGFTGFKEVKYLVRLARGLQQRGFITLRFDFSDCIGESEGSCEDMLLSHQVNDLISAINFLEEDVDIDPSRIGLAGHSLGGLTCIVVASTDKRPKALVSIASPAHHDWQTIFDQETVDRWQRVGEIEFPSFTRGHIRVHYHFLEDLREYDATKIIQNVRVPTCLIHGTEDSLVPEKNAHALYEHAHPPKALKLVEVADHFFLDEPSMEAMTCHAVGWFEGYLL
ncbi:MAG: alpha/beta fold hydrolase [Dehalococcoidia bacterium]